MKQEVFNNLKKGDYVKVREDLQCGNYFQIYVSEAMERLAGSVLQVLNPVDPEHFGTPVIALMGHAIWDWTADMLEGKVIFEGAEKEPESITEFEVGTVYIDPMDGDIVQKQPDLKVLRLSPSGNVFFDSVAKPNSAFWEPATEKQKQEFFAGVAKQLDPDEVYVVSVVQGFDWIMRPDQIDGVRMFSKVALDAKDRDFYSGKIYLVDTNEISTLRKATATEISLLEEQELEHGVGEKLQNARIELEDLWDDLVDEYGKDAAIKAVSEFIKEKQGE